MSDLCVTPHDTDRRALDGLRLCPGCRDWLAANLAELPGLHEQLGKNLGTGRGGGQRVSGTSAEPLPINPAIADHRDQIRHDLAWWCVYVGGERGVSLPCDSEPATTAAWLGRHVDWIAADRAGAEECPPVMRQLAGRARRLLDPDRRLPTGERCRVVPEGGERCHGTISMVQTGDEVWTARCSLCGPQEAAAYLHDTLAGRTVTIERVVQFARRRYGLAVEQTTVRSWARRGHIASTEQDGAVWYDLASVQKYLAGRKRMAS